MLDKILQAGSGFDWISPTIAFVHDIRNRPSVDINVPATAGWSAQDLTSLLQECGIKVWGVMLVGDVIIFSVRKAQALYAQYLLERNGIPYQGGLPGHSRARPAASQEMKAEQKPTGNWLDRLLVDIGGIVDRL
jgi:hypothetical protein